MQKQQWQDGVNLILGVWLVCSPFFGLGDATPEAAWNAWIIGAIVAVVALISMLRTQEWAEWVNLAAGIWLFFAPFVFDYAGVAGAAWNHLLVGAAVALVAIWGLGLQRRFTRAA